MSGGTQGIDTIVTFAPHVWKDLVSAVELLRAFVSWKC